jgi:iron complex transport system ATP-binding protein
MKTERERMCLQYDSVVASVGGKPILRGIDFSVEPGEIVGLVGRNGVGKTTLLRLAGGVLVPSAGRVLLGTGKDARPIGDYTRRELARRIALVPQDMHVPFPFRVGELVLMGRAPHQPLMGLESEADAELARRALDRLGILGLVDRLITTLSGGERQLVLFARALVQNPAVLLLDEPTAFLDLKHRVEVLREVRAFADSGGAALIVSHDLSLAARSCDRVVLLGAGVQIGVGRPEAVLTAENLREAFEIDAQIFAGPDGSLVVVPELARSSGESNAARGTAASDS